MFGLDYLIAPLSIDELIDSHWGKKAVYIPGPTDKFAGLYNWEAVNDILFSSRGYDGLRLLHEKKEMPAKSFKALDDWLAKGATLVINSVNSVDPLVSKFQDMLEYELNTHVNINSYMSYPAKQGFDTHFDFHDVFLVHTEGIKEWKIFEPTPGHTYPLHRLTNMDKGGPPEYDPYLQCTLTPGDVVYIPRGHWHYGIAIEPSIHLTVGPQARSTSELLQWWSRRLMDNSDDFYRRDIPIIGSSLMGGKTRPDAYREHMNEFRQRIKNYLDNDDFLDELVVRFCMLNNAQRQEFNLPKVWNEGKGLEPHTQLIIRSGQKFIVHYDDSRQSAILVIRGKELEIEGIPKLILAKVLSAQGGNSICGNDLLNVTEGVEWEKIDDWLKRLCQAKFLVTP